MRRGTVPITDDHLALYIQVLNPYYDTEIYTVAWITVGVKVAINKPIARPSSIIISTQVACQIYDMYTIRLTGLVNLVRFYVEHQ